MIGKARLQEKVRGRVRSPAGGALLNAPGKIRTRNLLIRSQVLCPVELRAHWSAAASGSRALTAASLSRRKCPGEDSNLHALTGTSPSSWRVCQFRHLGFSLLDARRGSRTPTGLLLPQDPESCASANSATRAWYLAPPGRSHGSTGGGTVGRALPVTLTPAEVRGLREVPAGANPTFAGRLI